MKQIFIGAVLLCAALYFLYSNGYMVTQMKRAIMYVESHKGRSATFSSCTGFTRRIVRFRESRSYHFTFRAALTQGAVSAELLDSAKQLIQGFDVSASDCDIALERKTRYYLVFRFAKASGKYEFDWA